MDQLLKGQYYWAPLADAISVRRLKIPDTKVRMQDPGDVSVAEFPFSSCMDLAECRLSIRKCNGMQQQRPHGCLCLLVP